MNTTDRRISRWNGAMAARRGSGSGLTLVETMIALTLLAIMSVTLLLIFTRGSQTYVMGRAEQESLRRVRLHVPVLMKEIRGAQGLNPAPPLTGSPALAYNYVMDMGGTPTVKWIQLQWNATTRNVLRHQYAADATPGPTFGNPVGGVETTRTLLENVDFLSFAADPSSSELVIVTYRLVTGLPAPLDYQYKLLFRPKLPVPAEE